MLRSIRETKFVGMPPQTLSAEMHDLPRNPAFLITFARYDYNTIVTETTLIKSQSKALGSKEIAEKRCPRFINQS